MENENNHPEFPEIDYTLLAKAKEYYTKLGYQYIEVPWIVSPEALMITHTSKEGFYDPYKSAGLIGSGEQGFLQLLLDKKLPPGKYQTITPCFRDDIPSIFHQRKFVKLELIDTELSGFDERHPEGTPSFGNMVRDAIGFFLPETDQDGLFGYSCSYQYNIKSEGLCKELVTNDIVLKYRMDIKEDGMHMDGAELGSYGIREYENIRWVYGTGLALPRFSTVMRLRKEAIIDFNNKKAMINQKRLELEALQKQYFGI